MLRGGRGAALACSQHTSPLLLRKLEDRLSLLTDSRSSRASLFLTLLFSLSKTLQWDMRASFGDSRGLASARARVVATKSTERGAGMVKGAARSGSSNL